MKAAAALAVVASVGFLAGGARADLVPVPTVPTVPPVPPLPVPTPSVGVPLPTVPKLPPPVLPEPVTSAAPAAAQVVSTPSSVTVSAGSAGFSPSGSASGSASRPRPAGSSSAPQQRARVTHFNASRPWIGTSGPKRRRTTTLIFVLPRATQVVFVVRQVSPACRTLGRFVVNGHPGVNRVRFAGRLHGVQLGAGTYKIAARTRGGRSVQRVTLVIVEGSAPTKAELAAARASNVCGAGARQLAATPGDSTGASNTAGVAEAAGVQRPSVIRAPRGSNTHSGAVLASTAEKTVRAIRPALVALLVAAILLLGLASLPRPVVAGPRVGELIVRHRLELAGVGAAAFVAVVIAFLA